MSNAARPYSVVEPPPPPEDVEELPELDDEEELLEEDELLDEEPLEDDELLLAIVMFNVVTVPPGVILRIAALPVTSVSRRQSFNETPKVRQAFGYSVPI
jgi:hypothetical protein